MSVNPARSTGPALLVGGMALHQLWLFWLAPIAGALVADGKIEHSTAIGAHRADRYNIRKS